MNGKKKFFTFLAAIAIDLSDIDALKLADACLTALDRIEKENNKKKMKKIERYTKRQIMS